MKDIKSLVFPGRMRRRMRNLGIKGIASNSWKMVIKGQLANLGLPETLLLPLFTATFTLVLLCIC